MKREAKLSTQDAIEASGIRSMMTRIEVDGTRAEEALPHEIFQKLESIAAMDPATIGIGVLFAGPSGTGKTMASRILASLLKMDLYRVDLAAIMNKYIGETEKNLHTVLNRAEELDVVLLLDEADSLFGKRTEVGDGHDRYANVEVGRLLQQMEDHKGLAILATNRRDSIDEAFLRRLGIIIEFPEPSAEDEDEENNSTKTVKTSTIAYKPRSTFFVKSDDEQSDEDR